MKVITFYSYKGGVGRTLAAANFAVYLAKLGLKTVVIDFDLEAPGIDAKFGLPELSHDQKGLLDYILIFQQTNQALENLQDIVVPVTLSNIGDKNLWLIPAGQYLSETYPRQLNQLDWSFIFSEERDGVAFFQQFLSRLESELKADFVIIDSRTGITESAGLCTQQLADEVVLLSSLSSEGIRFTKRIKELIQNSQISKALEKNIDIKIVISRVPKLDDLLSFKEECCNTFNIKDDKLFFLFSCPTLEYKEFLAINNPEIDEELVNNYVKLFYALDLELAEDKIIAEIENVTRRILLLSPEEAEKSIVQLATMYPHPEGYRAAMQFFRLRRQERETKIFAWKLFNSLPSPSDDEVQHILANMYLTSANMNDFDEKSSSNLFLTNAIRAIEPLFTKKLLNNEQIKIYTKILVKAGAYEQALEIASDLAENTQVDPNIQYELYLIASHCAKALENWSLANELEDKANFLVTSIAEDIPF